MAKWGMRLGVFDIHYKLRNSIKGQVLVDFVVDFTPPLPGSMGICQIKMGKWKVFMDGAFNVRGLGVEIVLILPKGVKLERLLRLGFLALNNKVEYEALIAGL